jgi:hypothetical protein
VACLDHARRQRTRTPADEGSSQLIANGKRVLLRKAVETLGEELLGPSAALEQGGWNVLCKLVDNMGPVPFHIHPGDEHASRVGRMPKAESCYYPAQLNLWSGSFPYRTSGELAGPAAD